MYVDITIYVDISEHDVAWGSSHINSSLLHLICESQN